MTVFTPYSTLWSITPPTASTIPTTPDTSLRDTFPRTSCPRLATVVSIQYFTSITLYLRTAAGPFISFLDAAKPSVFPSYGFGVTRKVFSSPFRSTTNVTALPVLYFSIIRLSSPLFVTFVPLTSRIVSFSFTPAFLKAPSSVTSETSAFDFSSEG